ncbi:MAG: bifunctional DNA-formamidopyrimidine glycosylase/DNA-(apurinic or apyrimidinic site) lyase [Nocardioidaceae bacterium]
MPELPEVEVVRRGLAEHVVGRSVVAVEVRNARSVRRHLAGPVDFVDRLTRRRVDAARRRGKYLWLALDDGSAVLGHLGMSGQLLVQPATAPDETHLRVRLVLDSGVQLRFVDQRMFGGLSMSEDGAALPSEIAHIAPDPFDPAFGDDLFATRIRRRRTGLKRALLDQRLISGVGNIYADEGLWLARLHYARPTETLTRVEVARMLGGVRAVMSSALSQGGTSFDALYVDINGRSGYFDRSLQVYGRDGQPCRRCRTPIRRDPFMNRSSYTCPRCQPRPRRARW